MEKEIEQVEVFITVKTYPFPQDDLSEIVCTAGITRSYEWIRLYPLHFRDLKQEQKFKKYQWISITLKQGRYNNDPRKESRIPDAESIKPGIIVTSKDKWRERRLIIDTIPYHTVKQLEIQYKESKISLGIVRPKEIIDLSYTYIGSNWNPKQQKIIDQLRFDTEQRELAKIPFKFQYHFLCEDNDKPHNAMITDWELGALYLNEFKRHESEEKAAESVKKKFLDELCSPKHDTRFFMGTVGVKNSWIVVGVFYPPKTGIEQGELFTF